MRLFQPSVTRDTSFSSPLGVGAQTGHVTGLIRSMSPRFLRTQAVEGSVCVHHSQPSAPEGGQELGGSQQPFLAQPPCLMAWGPHHDPPLVLPCCRQSSPQSCPRPHLVGVSRDYLTLMGCRGNPQANRWLLMGWPV